MKAQQTELAVSSFSLRREIGPVRFRPIALDGTKREMILPSPQSLTIADFAARVGAECGVALIEICQVQVQDRSQRAIDAIADGMSRGGVSLLTVPIDVGDISHPLAEVRRASIAENIGWFDFASALGARFVRVNAVSPHESTGAAAPRHDTLEALDRLDAAATERGMTLLLENKAGVRNYAEILLELLELLGSPRIGLILDTGNFDPLASAMIAQARGVEPPEDLELERLYQQIELLAPRATVVHAKAHHFDADGVQGPADLGRALRIIRDSGFAGPVTIEAEDPAGDPWLNARRTADIVRSVFP